MNDCRIDELETIGLRVHAELVVIRNAIGSDKYSAIAAVWRVMLSCAPPEPALLDSTADFHDLTTASTASAIAALSISRATVAVIAASASLTSACFLNLADSSELFPARIAADKARCCCVNCRTCSTGFRRLNRALLELRCRDARHSVAHEEVSGQPD